MRHRLKNSNENVLFSFFKLLKLSLDDFLEALPAAFKYVPANTPDVAEDEAVSNVRADRLFVGEPLAGLAEERAQEVA